MENINLLEKEAEGNTTKKIKGLPHFVIIQKAEGKKIKIPCANENVAKKILASYSNYNSNCKIFFM